MKRKQVMSIFMAAALCMGMPQPAFAQETSGDSITFSEEEILNKMKGGWVGEMAGVTWAAPTEFYDFGKFFEIDPDMTIIPDDLVPEWTPETINDAFNQDDLYVDVTFLDCLKENGTQTDWSVYGKYFGESQYRLWHANRWGRDNVRAGIDAPWSGHYSNTLHADRVRCYRNGMPGYAGGSEGSGMEDWPCHELWRRCIRGRLCFHHVCKGIYSDERGRDYSGRHECNSAGQPVLAGAECCARMQGKRYDLGRGKRIRC